MSVNDKKNITRDSIDTDVTFTDSVSRNSSFTDHGDTDENDIAVELPIIKKGNKTTVHYNGLLNNNGAEKVYLHYGFDGWKHTNTVPMKKSHGRCYSMQVNVDGRNEMNFCFKDNSDHWDNNSGSNWSVGIESK